MSTRTDQGLPAKVTDAALLEEGARILSASPVDAGRSTGPETVVGTSSRRGTSRRRSGAATSKRRAS